MYTFCFVGSFAFALPCIYPSPVLFAIYIAEVHTAVEGQVLNSCGISFVDDVTWLVEGQGVGEVVQKLERCATASLAWAVYMYIKEK